MVGRGHRLSKADVERIESLLLNTDMSMVDIAVRMQCSKQAVIAINRKGSIRRYDGYRSRWGMERESGSFNGRR
jgi:ribosomal protein S13